MTNESGPNTVERLPVLLFDPLDGNEAPARAADRLANSFGIIVGVVLPALYMGLDTWGLTNCSAVSRTV